MYLVSKIRRNNFFYLRYQRGSSNNLQKVYQIQKERAKFRRLQIVFRFSSEFHRIVFSFTKFKNAECYRRDIIHSDPRYCELASIYLLRYLPDTLVTAKKDYKKTLNEDGKERSTSYNLEVTSSLL